MGRSPQQERPKARLPKGFRDVEAEEIQKRIQEQIGAPDEGLRLELDKLEKLLKEKV